MNDELWAAQKRLSATQSDEQAGDGVIPCRKCGGSGWYAHDHNHSKPCEVCCRHNQGVWQLLEYYGYDNGKWCCRAGCGQTWDGISDYNRAGKS